MKDLLLLWRKKEQRCRSEGEGNCQWSEEDIDDRIKSLIERLPEANSSDSGNAENLLREVAATAKSIEDAADKTNTTTMRELSRDAAAVNKVAKNEGTRVYDGNTPIEVMRHTLDGMPVYERLQSSVVPYLHLQHNRCSRWFGANLVRDTLQLQKYTV